MVKRNFSGSCLRFTRLSMRFGIGLALSLVIPCMAVVLSLNTYDTFRNGKSRFVVQNEIVPPER